MFGWVFVTFLIGQEANGPDSIAQPPLQPKSIETKTPIGRVEVGVDGNLESKGQKDVAIGYVYSIKLSDSVKSSFDLQPFFVQRVDVDEQGVRADTAQGAGIMIKFKPGEKDQASWYARLKYLVDESAPSLGTSQNKEDWQISFGIEVPLDSQAKQRRRLKALKRLEPKPTFTLSVPLGFFESLNISREDQKSLHSLIVINYLIRLSEYLTKPVNDRTPLANEANLLDIQHFPDPNQLIEMDVARSHIENPDLERKSKTPRQKVEELLSKYTLLLKASTPTELRLVSVHPTGYLFDRDRGRFLAADQIVEDFVEVLNSTNTESIAPRLQTSPTAVAR